MRNRARGNASSLASIARACRDGAAFVAKLSPDGSHLLYSTYLGGSIGDGARGIAVDTSGDAYVTGWTQSSDFRTTAGVLLRNFGRRLPLGVASAERSSAICASLTGVAVRTTL